MADSITKLRGLAPILTPLVSRVVTAAGLPLPVSFLQPLLSRLPQAAEDALERAEVEGQSADVDQALALACYLLGRYRSDDASVLIVHPGWGLIHVPYAELTDEHQIALAAIGNVWSADVERLLADLGAGGDPVGAPGADRGDDRLG